MFATLRFTHIRRRIARTLEAETGLNDPVAIALTIGLITWIEDPTFGFPDLVFGEVRQLALGLLVGVVLGAAAMWVFARLPDSIGAFAPVASVATAAVTFGLADVIHGSGFLAVYLVGLAVGSTSLSSRRSSRARRSNGSPSGSTSSTRAPPWWWRRSRSTSPATTRLRAQSSASSGSHAPR